MRRLWLGFTLGCAALLAACAPNDDPDGGPMTTGCARTSECQNGTVCVIDTCRTPGSVQQNGACAATRDCTAGLYCEPLMGRCQAAGTGLVGVGCSSDAQCVPGLRCASNGVTGVCTTGGNADYGAQCQFSSECLAGLYCSAALSCQPFKTAFTPATGPSCIADTGPFRSFFEVPRSGFPRDFYRLPYPSDLRTAAAAPRLDLSDFPRAGGGILGVDVVDLYADTLVEDFDGFSPLAAISFRFSQEIDFGFLQEHQLEAIRIVDLDTGVGLLAFGYGFGPSRTRFSCENLLTVYPTPTSAPLAHGHQYAAILTTAGFKSTAGAAPAQDADLVAMLGASRPGDAALGAAWDRHAKLRAFMSTEGIAPTSVVNAAVFTVANPTDTMRKLAAAVAGGPAPVLSSLYQCGSGGTDPCDDGTAARRCGADDPDFVEIHGKIRLPIFQAGTAPYLKPADGGAINLQGGNPAKVRDEEVCFALTLPRDTAPAAGWPLVVYGHGTGGSFRSFIADGVAAQLAKATPRMAGFAMDSVLHGARRGASTASPDVLVFNAANPRAARDNFLQGAADLLSAFRLPAATISGTWTGPTLKFPAKVAYYGHSQGATHGSLAVPFTDDVGAVVMSGAGANLTSSLLSKTSPSNYGDALRFLFLEPVDGSYPVMILWQQFFDRADPANYNPLLLRAPPAGRTAKHVLMTWGKSDTYSPGGSLKWNALTTGLPPTPPLIEDLGDNDTAAQRPITRNIGGATTGVFIQYQPSGYDGHFVAWRNSDAARDVTAFLASFFAAGAPIID